MCSVKRLLGWLHDADRFRRWVRHRPWSVQVLPRDGDAEVVTTIDQSPPGSQLRIRVSDGSITAAGMGTQRAD